MTRRLMLTGTATAVALSLAATAAAHSGVQRRLPASGASLSAGPRTVAITFEQRVLGGGTLTVRRSGKVKLRGSTDRTNARRLVAKAKRRLPRGVYRVSWRATSLDGHKLSGSWSAAQRGERGFLSARAARNPRSTRGGTPRRP